MAGVEEQVTNVVPAKDGTCDSFHLYQLNAGRLARRRPVQGLTLAHGFDTRVLPYASVWASYGGFDGHYTVLLEPSISGKTSESNNVSL